MVKPRSAIIDIPDFPSIFCRNPHVLVNSTSDIDPTYSGETYEIAPFGVQAIRNFNVLWCL